MNLNTTLQAFKQGNIHSNISSGQPPRQEELKIKSTSSRQHLKQEKTMQCQSLKQENITSILSHPIVNIQSEHQLQEEEELKPQGIFVYGTLMAQEFLSWVLTGSAENHEAVVSLRQPATLHCYRRVAVVHADYPALIRGNEFDKVEGFLIVPSTRCQWKKLGDFEGESYCRQYVQVELCHSKRFVPAFVYLWQDSMDKLLLPYQDWSYEYFREHWLEDWLDLFEEMEMVGEG